MWFCRSPFWTQTSLESLEFTTCFENTVFVWIPSFTLWIGGVVHVIINRRKTLSPIGFTVLGTTRTLLTVALIMIQSSIAYIHYKNNDSPDMIVSALQRTCNAFVVLGLQSWYMRKGKPSSMFLTVYWLLVMTCDTFKFYRILMLHLSRREKASVTDTIKCVSFLVVVMEFLLSCFNDKSSEKQPSDRSPIQRLTFGWLSSRIFKCYKGSLTLEDIQLLPIEAQTTNNTAKSKIAAYTQSSYKHWTHLVIGHQASIVYASFLNVIFIVLRISSSLMLNAIVLYMEGKTDKYKGYMYVISIFLLNLIASLVLRHSEYILMIVGLQVKSVIINAIYRKVMKLSASRLRVFTSTEVMNMIANDAEKINTAIGFAGIISGGPVQVIYTTIALWQFLGPSCMAGIATLVAIILATAWLAEEVKLLQNKRGQLATSRQKKLIETVQHIRVIKLFDWENVFVNVIGEARHKETRSLKKLTWAVSTIRCAWAVTPFLVVLAAFYSYLTSNNILILQASIAYVCMSLFNGMRFALSILPDAITAFVQANSSLNRIFLFLDESEAEQTIFVAKSGTLINGEMPMKRDLIKLYNATLAWGNDIVLKRVCMSVKRGELVAIVGETGCGKSSLLHALLGELRILEGSVQVNGSVSFCSQSAWTLNDTIKNNILVRFKDNFDQKRYERVVEACQLKELFGNLPLGDETVISYSGMKSIITSEHRRLIHLARAVYREADIYFFDTPMGGLNSTLATQVLQNVISRHGLLANKTKVVVVNNADSLPEYDRIIVLHKGSIVEEGNYRQLVKNKRRFSSTIGDLLDNIGDFFDATMAETMADNAKPDQDEMFEYMENKFTLERSNSYIGDAPENLGANSISFNLEEEDTLTVKRVTWLTYWRVLVNLNLLFVFEITFLFIITRSLDIFAGLLFSRYSLDDPTMSVTKRNLRLAAYGGLGIGHGILSLISTLILRRRLINETSKRHNEIVNKLIRAPFQFFCIAFPSAYQNRFFKDIDQMDIQFPMAATLLLELFFQLVAVIMLNCIVLPPIIIICIPLVLLGVTLQILYIRTLRQLKRFDMQARALRREHVCESLLGQTTIRHHELVDFYTKRMNTLADDVQKCSYLMMMARFWMTIRLDAIGNILVLAINLLVITERGFLRPALAGFLSSYTLGTVNAFNSLIHYAAEVALSLVTVYRLNEFSSRIHSETSSTICGKSNANRHFCVKGAIKFENYTTRYTPNTPSVLKRLHLSINNGEKIGVVGHAGAGKSTLAYALFKLIDPVDGDLYIDNKSIMRLNTHLLRKQLTILPQETALFSATLRFNLDPTGKCTEKQLWTAIETSRFNGTLPEGLDTKVGEDSGYYLSQGQRHLMCLARALLRKNRIVVIDEIATSVDLETEQIIMQTVLKEFKNSTIIIITNKIYNVMNCDRIIVMEDGKIIEEGCPVRLIHDSRSHFHALAEAAGVLHAPTFDD